MIGKKCITDDPVSAAFLSSPTGAIRHIASYTNRSDDSEASGVSSVNPHPFSPSRVRVHSFSGLLELEVALDWRRERVLCAAVSEDGVMACQVLSLPSQKCSTTNLQTEQTSDEHIIFFSGRQRLAEVTLTPNVNTHAQANAVMPFHCDRYLMQCLHAPEIHAHVAVFVNGLDTVCACVPQPCKEQRIRFDGRVITCMGVGRQGEPEVTILLDDHTVVVCGVRPWASSASKSTTAVIGDELPQPPSSAQFVILKTGNLLEASGDPRLAPIRVAWRAKQDLWVVYENGSVCAFSSPNNHLKRSSLRSDEDGEDASTSGNIEFTLVYSDKLPFTTAKSLPTAHLFLQTEYRIRCLHYCYLEQEKCLLHYGCIRLHDSLPDTDESGPRSVRKKLHHTLSFSDNLYGLHVEGNRYHVLAQSPRDDGVLYLMTLSLSYTASESIAAGALPHKILHAQESDLAGHCRTCESRIALIRQADVSALQHSEEAKSILAQLKELEDGAYVLLHREHSSVGERLSPSHSYPQRILREVSHAWLQWSIYLFLGQLDALQGIEQPLRESLGLGPARTLSMDAHESLMNLINDVFPLFHTAGLGSVEFQFPRGALCVDTILEYLGFSSETSLMLLLRDATEVSPVLVLLILYYSYQKSFHVVCDRSDDDGLADPDYERLAHKLREEFLTSRCKLPASINTWAFACYAVDHGVNPLAKSDSGVPLYTLGSCVSHLNNPPVLALLPTLMTGLLNVVALDAVYQQIPALLGLFNNTSLPASLVLKLCYVALKTHGQRILYAMYYANRYTANEDTSIQALALAALQVADMSPLRGVIRVGSAKERILEKVFSSCRSITRRKWVQLRFYIFTRRYTDALRVCNSFTAEDMVTGQLTQLVASYLRSLMPMGNEQYRLQYLRHVSPVSVANLQLNEESEEQEPLCVNELTSKEGISLAGRAMASTSLEHQQYELDAQVRSAIARSTPHSGRWASRLLNLPTSSFLNVSTATALRPSTILSSLDRREETFFTLPNTGSQLEIDKEDEDTRSSNAKSSVECSVPEPRHARDWLDTGENYNQQQNHNYDNECTSTIFNISTSAFNDAVLCEARLQRSGKMCNRPRPCPYHDRKGRC